MSLKYYFLAQKYRQASSLCTSWSYHKKITPIHVYSREEEQKLLQTAKQEWIIKSFTS